ncbi:MAG: PAS domain S-box protein [Pseudomonadales bacterium]|nr:PAS domain S-box protein [Pseudomonadales bacterium]
MTRILAGDTEIDEANFRFKTAGGEFRHVHAIARLWQHNNEIGLIVNSRDITTQHEALEQLARSNELLSKIYSASSNLISVTLPETGEFLDVNDAWCETSGYTREEIIGRTAIELGIWGSVENREQIVDKLNSQGFLDKHRSSVYTKNGKERVMEIDARLLHVAEEPRILMSCHDLTESLVTEDALRQAQKMEAVGQLTGGVAHDFNNLIGVTMGSAELLLRNLGPEDPNHKLATQILEASTKAAELTRQLLAFSRRQTLTPQPLSLLRKLEELFPLLQTSMGENFDIAIDADGDTWPCYLDSAQLENALLNLSLNARDAMPSGGTLHFTISNLELAAGDPVLVHRQPSGDYVRLSVIDEGVGMDEEAKLRAFEPFFTTKQTGKGTGLGLSMVFGFAKQSGGFITLENNLAEGTRVDLYFPRHSGVSDIVPSDPLTHPEAVLAQTAIVLEDNAPLRQLVVYYLEELGYSVAEAGNTLELENVISNTSNITLVVSDILLQGPQKGPELIANYATQLQDASILYITGFDAGDSLHSNDLCLYKPFSRDQFMDAVAHARQRQVSLTPSV